MMNWNDMGSGMGFGMGFGWLFGLLILALVVLAIASAGQISPEIDERTSQWLTQSIA